MFCGQFGGSTYAHKPHKKAKFRALIILFEFKIFRAKPPYPKPCERITLTDTSCRYYGWGLGAHAVQAEAWQGQLTRLGIKIEPWPELPIKPWVYNYTILIPLGVIVAVPLVATIVGAFIGASILGWVMHRHSRKIRHIRIAPGLRKVLACTSIKDNYAYSPVMEGGE